MRMCKLAAGATANIIWGVGEYGEAFYG
jgi:hypothetical protein